MIIVRSPMRISLGGGGTDLPSYYWEHGGFVIAAAIDKYVYVTLHETFEEKLILKYSKMETVERVVDVQHPIIREALRLTNIKTPHLEISSMSDIPAGTGLGSSGSFTVALLQALYNLQQQTVDRSELAERACHIEINVLKEPVGKQDQYIASYGGVTCFDFERNGKVAVTPLQLDPLTLANLEDNLVLFFAGSTRNASEILQDQDTRSKQADSSMVENLHTVKRLGLASKAALEAGNLRDFAIIMNSHWGNKKRRTPGMSNSRVDQYYELAMNSGALGGKLVGAGGGGFLMFYTEDKTRLRQAMYRAGLREVRFRFDFQGCTAIVPAGS